MIILLAYGVSKMISSYLIYLSNKGGSKNNTGHDRGKHLSKPVKESSGNTNMAGDGHSERHSRVEMSAGDVGGNVNSRG